MRLQSERRRRPTARPSLQLQLSESALHQRHITCSFLRESARGRSALSFVSPKNGKVACSHAASESVCSFASSRAVCWNAERSSFHACDAVFARIEAVRALPRVKAQRGVSRQRAVSKRGAKRGRCDGTFWGPQRHTAQLHGFRKSLKPGPGAFRVVPLHALLNAHGHRFYKAREERTVT